jgi:hypothetical protein
MPNNCGAGSVIVARVTDVEFRKKKALSRGDARGGRFI